MPNNVVTKIDTKKVNAAGENIINQGNAMYNALKNIEELMKSSAKSFDSEAGEKLRANFRASAEKFEEFKKEVASYGNYLKNYGENQEAINIKIGEIASQIPKLD